MTVKKLETITPTHYITDKKGNKIAVYRGGILDKNKYAKKTPFEKEIDANINNPNYRPGAKPMIDFTTIKVGDCVRVTGAGARGFAEMGEVLTIVEVGQDEVIAQRMNGNKARFTTVHGAARLELVKEIADGSF